MTAVAAMRHDTAVVAPVTAAPSQPSLPWQIALEVDGPGFAASAGVSGLYDPLKRVLDVVVASALLVMLAPLMLAVAAAIRLSSPGGVLFRQMRAGEGGRAFLMFKFRTMRIGAERDRAAVAHLNQMRGSPVFKIPADPRITRLGRLLRRTSIDELPQLFNVLAGHMSLVGPRPLWMPEALETGPVAQLRWAVRPGLTCLWQISGRSELSYEQWVHLDLYYIQHRSTLLDLLIMAQTMPAVLSAKGAY